MRVSGSFYAFFTKRSHTHKKHKKQLFFILDVFMRTKSTKSSFLYLRCFYAYKKHKKRLSSSQMFFMDIKMLPFLFAFALFVFFTPNKRLSSSQMFFMRIKMLPFLFTYVLFVFFMRVGSFRKSHKTTLIPSFSILLGLRARFFRKKRFKKLP